MRIQQNIVALSGCWMLAISSTHAINITPVAGPGDAITLATMLDGSPEITVNAATFNIDLAGGGTQASNLRAIGTFTMGNDATGFPAINQPAVGGPISYSGGIGIDVGVCLSTGLVSDSDVAGASAASGSAVGMEGPNNGFAITQITSDAGGPNGFQSDNVNAGEASFRLQTSPDDDFVNLVRSANVSGDATVLQCDITLSAPGFLRLSFVMASDENPAWIDPNNPLGDFNDSMGIFVRKNTPIAIPYENIATLIVNGVEQSMSLQELVACGAPIFFNNQVVPAPTGILSSLGNGVGEFRTSDHGFDTNNDTFNLPDDNVNYYNHEFGGFSKKLTRETPCVLGPGEYAVKIVIQDVFDLNVDSGVFLAEDSLKLFAFLPADFNLDGMVGAADLSILSSNWGASNVGFVGGDADCSGLVSGGDLNILLNSWGATGGNIHFCADFDRDSDVDGADFLTWQRNTSLSQCASKFEGDADRDGDVDSDDLAIWQAERGGTPSGLCGCESVEHLQGGGAALLAQPNVEAKAVPIPGAFSIPAPTPNHPLDTNQDGNIDKDDIELFLKLKAATE